MCGIVGYVGRQECGELLLAGLRKLEYRGYDSAGLAVLHEGVVTTRKAEGKLVNLEAAYRAEAIPGTLGVAHTRWATHGRPSEENAHPHHAGNVVVVHNGIIENHLELRDELMRRGRSFASETDTEILAHLIDEALMALADDEDEPLHAATRAALGRVRGSYALLVISADYPGQIVAARQASPLIIGVGQGEMFAASDIPAVMAHTREFVFVEDGDTVILEAGGRRTFDREGLGVDRPSKFIAWDPVSAEKQGYKHFMLKEIFEQPAKVTDTIRGRISLERGDVNLGESGLTAEFAATATHIQIIACGTSYHAGLVGRHWIEELAGVHTTVDVASEFRYGHPVLDAHTLTIALSQSGETADTLAAIKLARELGSTVLSICNVMESSIPRASDGVIYTHAGPEIGVASTKAFTTQLVALFLFATWLGRRRGTLDTGRGRRLLESLTRVPAVMEALLADLSPYEGLARRYASSSSFLYLGRGNNYPIALEGALKLKEISYIHAEGYPAGEMKHGPIALIDDSLPVVVIAPRSATYEKVFSNLEEVRARGGQVIAVGNLDDRRLEEYADALLGIPDVAPEVQPLLTVLPLQLLAYHIADFKGTDVDQPRNLAKSVTVE